MSLQLDEFFARTSPLIFRGLTPAVLRKSGRGVTCRAAHVDGRHIKGKHLAWFPEIYAGRHVWLQCDVLAGGRYPDPIGKRFHVKEPWCIAAGFDDVPASLLPSVTPVHYCTDGPAPAGFGKERPAIRLPSRWVRTAIELTDVRIKRVQDLTAEEMTAEIGPIAENEPALADVYRRFWDDGYRGEGLGWHANPWTWVLEFRCIEIGALTFAERRLEKVAR